MSPSTAICCATELQDAHRDEKSYRCQRASPATSAHEPPKRRLSPHGSLPSSPCQEARADLPAQRCCRLPALPAAVSYTCIAQCSAVLSRAAVAFQDCAARIGPQHPALLPPCPPFLQHPKPTEIGQPGATWQIGTRIKDEQRLLGVCKEVAPNFAERGAGTDRQTDSRAAAAQGRPNIERQL